MSLPSPLTTQSHSISVKKGGRDEQRETSSCREALLFLKGSLKSTKASHGVVMVYGALHISHSNPNQQPHKHPERPVKAPAALLRGQMGPPQGDPPTLQAWLSPKA